MADCVVCLLVVCLSRQGIKWTEVVLPTIISQEISQHRKVDTFSCLACSTIWDVTDWKKGFCLINTIQM